MDTLTSAGAVIDREIVTTRVLNAPREQVFNAWTDPDILARWWGPKGFTNTFDLFEPKPAGKWLFTMHGPDGTEYRNKSVFVEVSAPSRIVFDHLHPMHQFRTTVTFEETGGGTRLVWCMLFASADEYDKVRAFVAAANEENLDKLEAVLTGSEAAVAPDRSIAPSATERELTITRVFHAPRSLVWRAWTDPQHMVRWWGPHECTNPVCEMDVRPGGRWSILMRMPDGMDYPLKGVFHEVEPRERLVLTMNVKDHPTEWHAALNEIRGRTPTAEEMEILTTVTFSEHEGATTVHITQRFASSGERDVHVKLGVRKGWGQSLDKLEELLLHP